MQIQTLEIDGPFLITPRRIGDNRGYFAEIFRQDRLPGAAAGLSFPQHNDSFSALPGTVRGLHFQLAPAGRAKIVRCLTGAILDVIVDLRRGSPTFGRHLANRLDAADSTQIFVPEGFAHGFCTLQPDTCVHYLVSETYAPGLERGLLWNDPALAIAWPVTADAAILSEKDRSAPTLAELDEWPGSGGQ